MLSSILFVFFFNDTATTEIYTLSLHDALPIFDRRVEAPQRVNEPTEFREGVSLVQPGDLVVRVDIERGVDRPQGLVVAAEPDEGGPLPVQGDFRTGHAQSGRGDRPIVIREGLLVVLAPHVPLGADQLLTEARRGVAAEDFCGREGRGLRHGSPDADDPW